MVSVGGAVVLLLALSGLCSGQRKLSRTSPVTAEVKTGVNFDCPEEFGYYPHPNDCTQYYVCVFGGALLESCTGGLMYSHELQTCDWPRNVGCDAAGDAIQGTASPSTSSRVEAVSRTRYTPPPPPQPAAVVTSRGQPRQLHHNQQDIIKQQQQQLYEDADETLPPAEEIENDRQQRVYRGHPSTVGQVQRDRDGLRHSNAIPNYSGRSEKIGVISFGTQSQQSQPIQQQQYRKVTENDVLFTNDLETLEKRSERYKRQTQRSRHPSNIEANSWRSSTSGHKISFQTNPKSSIINLHPPPIQKYPPNTFKSYQSDFKPLQTHHHNNQDSEFKPFIPLEYTRNFAQLDPINNNYQFFSINPSKSSTERFPYQMKINLNQTYHPLTFTENTRFYNHVNHKDKFEVNENSVLKPNHTKPLTTDAITNGFKNNDFKIKSPASSSFSNADLDLEHFLNKLRDSHTVKPALQSPVPFHTTTKPRSTTLSDDYYYDDDEEEEVDEDEAPKQSSQLIKPSRGNAFKKPDDDDEYYYEEYDYPETEKYEPKIKYSDTMKYSAKYNQNEMNKTRFNQPETTTTNYLISSPLTTPLLSSTTDYTKKLLLNSVIYKSSTIPINPNPSIRTSAATTGTSAATTSTSAVTTSTNAATTSTSAATTSANTATTSAAAANTRAATTSTRTTPKPLYTVRPRMRSSTAITTMSFKPTGRPTRGKQRQRLTTNMTKNKDNKKDNKDSQRLDKQNNRVEATSVGPSQQPSVATATARALYNGSQHYNPNNYDPYYTLYEDDVELYRDVDYSQQYNGNNNNNGQTYRGTPAPAAHPSPAPEEPKRGNAGYIQNTYTTQDVYQQPSVPDYNDDNSFNSQVDDDSYRQTNQRQPIRGDRNEINYVEEIPTTKRITTTTTTSTTTTPRSYATRKSTVPVRSKANQTRAQSLPYTLPENPGHTSPTTSRSSDSNRRQDNLPAATPITYRPKYIPDTITDFSLHAPVSVRTAIVNQPSPFILPTVIAPKLYHFITKTSKSTPVSTTTTTTTTTTLPHKDANKRKPAAYARGTDNYYNTKIIIPTTYAPPKFFLKSILPKPITTSTYFESPLKSTTTTTTTTTTTYAKQQQETKSLAKAIKQIRNFLNPVTINNVFATRSSLEYNPEIVEIKPVKRNYTVDYVIDSRIQNSYKPRLEYAPTTTTHKIITSASTTSTSAATTSVSASTSTSAAPTSTSAATTSTSAATTSATTTSTSTTPRTTTSTTTPRSATVSRTTTTTPASVFSSTFAQLFNDLVQSEKYEQFVAPYLAEVNEKQRFRDTVDLPPGNQRFRNTVELPPANQLPTDSDYEKPEPDQAPTYKPKQITNNPNQITDDRPLTNDAKTTTGTGTVTTSLSSVENARNTSIPARVSRVNAAIKSVIGFGGARRQNAKCENQTTNVKCNEVKRTNNRGRGSAHYANGGANGANNAAEPSNRGTPPTRSRPTLKPSTSIVSKVQEFVDVYRFPPTRPDPIYPTPQADKTAAKCRKDVCLLPDCSCGGKEIPGELTLEETPQMVLMTFDDAVNDLNKIYYTELFENGRVNPNGCPISATFYVSHEWTDYSQVQNLYADGHEMASHTVSHSFGEQFSQKKWTREVAGQREILSAYGGVKLEDVRGMRAPFLSVGGNKMFKMLYDSNFTYDSSMPIYENKPPSWPYTLDYKLFHDCMIPPCPTRSYPGVWEVPMVMWQDLNGGRCSMGDACSNPSESDGVFKMLMKNFDRHYTTNRAPFGLFYHAAWFTQPHHKEGFIKFLDAINQMPDVFLVTNWQAIQWVRDPTPISRIGNFQPFQCNYADRPKRCNNPKVCNLWHKSGVRYMRTCQPCPDIYPWTGNSGIRSSRIDNDIED